MLTKFFDVRIKKDQVILNKSKVENVVKGCKKRFIKEHNRQIARKFSYTYYILLFQTIKLKIFYGKKYYITFASFQNKI